MLSLLIANVAVHLLYFSFIVATTVDMSVERKSVTHSGGATAVGARACPVLAWPLCDSTVHFCQSELANVLMPTSPLVVRSFYEILINTSHLRFSDISH